MEIEITIRYSDDRACTMTFRRPDSGEVLYRIVTAAAGIPRSFGDGLREARRMFGMEPWTSKAH